MPGKNHKKIMSKALVTLLLSLSIMHTSTCFAAWINKTGDDCCKNLEYGLLQNILDKCSPKRTY